MRDVMWILLYLFFSSFRDTLFLYIGSCNRFYTYIYLFFSICRCMFLSPTFTCVVSFLPLYTRFLLIVCNLLFLFHTKMP